VTTSSTGGPGGPTRLDVAVNAGDFRGVPHALIRAAVVHALEHEGVRRGEVSVTMLSDDEIRAMNRDYLSKDRPTDVIAFSLGGDEGVMGDVYVGLEQARRQADELGIPAEEEIARLAVHGVLHVLGHEHPEDAGREDSPMYRLQERLLDEVLRGR